MKKQLRIPEASMIDAWSKGAIFTLDNKEYTTHKMSYGDYFLEPANYRGGETDPICNGTMWLKRELDANKRVWYILDFIEGES